MAAALGYYVYSAMSNIEEEEKAEVKEAAGPIIKKGIDGRPWPAPRQIMSEFDTPVEQQ